MGKDLKWSSMLLSEGCLDILQYLKENGVSQFKQLSNLKNKRTGKTFSPNTVSARLDELEQMNAIGATSLKTERKRVLGYQITQKGIEILNAAQEFEQKLKGIIGK